MFHNMDKHSIFKTAPEKRLQETLLNDMGIISTVSQPEFGKHFFQKILRRSILKQPIPQQSTEPPVLN